MEICKIICTFDRLFGMAQDLAARLKSKVEELIARCETLDRENADLKARLDRYERSDNKKELKIKDLAKPT